MTNPLTEAREAVAQVLKAALPDLTLYGAPPETASPPAALIMASDEWAAPLTYGKTKVGLTVTCLATSSGSNLAAMERLESLSWAISEALTAQEIVVVGPIRAPRLVKIGSAEVAAADLSLTLHVTDT